MDYREPEEMITYLKTHLSKKRFGHSMRVAKLSKDLAILYKVDPVKAYFAGLVHDLAKEYDTKTCETYIEQAGIVKDPCIKECPNLAHGEIAAYVLKKDFNIADEEILNAVRWHTYGREHMSTLDKIVYLADVVEPKRDFENLDKLRQLTRQDLDAAINYFFDLCTLYLTRQNQPIHENTYKMLKYLNC